jgi:DNA-binding CsgD family transcriptional regulator
MDGLTHREVMDVARAVCTDRQFAVVQLRETGMGWKAMALILSLDPATVRGHYRAAVVKIEKEVARVQVVRSDPSGPAAP